jgi:post-segregation antitoxin (ccd killing protein)
MFCGMGSKTSVYLPDDLTERWKASGLSLTEIVRRGLDAEPQEAMLRRVLRQELAALEPRSCCCQFPSGDGLPAPEGPS